MKISIKKTSNIIKESFLIIVKIKHLCIHGVYALTINIVIEIVHELLYE